MLAGIILQPGAWDTTRGPLDDVFIANNAMQNVASALVLWTKSDNPVGKVVVSGLWATGVYRSAMSFESWADKPIENVELRDVQVEYSGGGKAPTGGAKVTSPDVDARALPVWGLYARNVRNLTVQDVRVTVATNDFRPVLAADGVERLDLEAFKFSPVAGAPEPIVTNNVGVLINEP